MSQTMVRPAAQSIADAVPARAFRSYMDFEVGATIEHPLSRTVTEADNLFFNLTTLHYNRAYFDAEYAQTTVSGRIEVNPYFGFLLVFGLSVEDLSEFGGGGKGGFLGIEDLTFARPLFPGDTVKAASTVVAKRLSTSRPDVGIVTWHTVGRVDGQILLEYTRSNLLSASGSGSGEQR